MPRISQAKKDKISEQILHYLFSVAPELKFTAEVAREIARDEEFTLALLEELKSKSLIVPVDKNPQGISYIKRQRWRLSNEAYTAYARQQSKSYQLPLEISQDQKDPQN